MIYGIVGFVLRIILHACELSQGTKGIWYDFLIH